jgi:hypothetical protein
VSSRSLEVCPEPRYGRDMNRIRETDEQEDRIETAIGRIREGERAIVAIARGESVDPRLIDQVAENLADLLGPGVTASWTLEDVNRVRRLRSLVTAEPPSSEARALAATYTPYFFADETEEPAA